MKTIWTIGHSNRSFDEFLSCLTPPGIECLVDVRRYPGSKAHPQFGLEALHSSLQQHNIQYIHSVKLGGRRKPDPDSPNNGWRNTSFRAYADFMGTDDFREGISELLENADKMHTAYMCSEALWWRCHRRLISDYLVMKGWNVIHIMGTNKTEQHRLMEPAKIIDGRLSYSA